MNTRFVIATLVLAGSVAAPRLSAHHSFAMYDVRKTMVITGVVTRVDPNPNHLQVFFAPLADRGHARRLVFVGLALEVPHVVMPSRQKAVETDDARSLLEQRIAAMEQRFEGVAVPRPPHWSGFRVVPEMVEFWYGARYRLHERQRYERADGAWRQQMLYP